MLIHEARKNEISLLIEFRKLYVNKVHGNSIEKKKEFSTNLFRMMIKQIEKLFVVRNNQILSDAFSSINQIELSLLLKFSIRKLQFLKVLTNFNSQVLLDILFSNLYDTGTEANVLRKVFRGHLWMNKYLSDEM